MGFILIMVALLVFFCVYYRKVIMKKYEKTDDERVIYGPITVFGCLVLALIFCFIQGLFGYEDWQLIQEIPFDNEKPVISTLAEANAFLNYFEDASLEALIEGDVAYKTDVSLSYVLLECSDVVDAPMFQLYERKGVRNFWTFLVNEAEYKGVILIPEGTLNLGLLDF